MRKGEATEGVRGAAESGDVAKEEERRRNYAAAPIHPHPVCERSKCCEYTECRRRPDHVNRGASPHHEARTGLLGPARSAGNYT